MKKPRIAIVAVGILAAISLTAYGTYLKKQPSFEIFGEDLLTTTASDDIVARARFEVHERFVDWQKNANGKPYDPSFLERGRSWTHQTNDGQTAIVGRGTTEFNDADGHHITIEVITRKDMPTLVFFSPQSGNGTMPVLNAFAASLQKRGVKLAGH